MIADPPAMARTREEFVKRWQAMLAGMALFGAVSEARDGPVVRASKIMDIPAEVQRLLGLMYDDLVPRLPLPARPQAHANGSTKEKA